MWVTPSTTDGARRRYCNGVDVLFTQFDFSLEFVELVPIAAQEPGGSPTVSRNFVERIVMSPQQAKVFLQLLAQNVDDYESRFGELPASPQPPAQPQQNEGEPG
jgi:hypothetical protein